MSTVLTLGYNSSKAAVNMVTVMLANELRGTGILVNAAVAVRLATLGSDGATGEVHAEADRLPW
jgi:NAD(P)-dependent dehydrogenase (short-subunit alcohol dehydrogenase family)